MLVKERLRGHVHPPLEHPHPGREAVGSEDLAVERKRGVSGVVTDLEAVVEEEERTGIRELAGPLAPATHAPDQGSVGCPDRHLQALHVEHVDAGAVGCGAHVQDPAEERVPLHLVAEFVFRRGDPVLDGGDGDDGGVVRTGGEGADG